LRASAAGLRPASVSLARAVREPRAQVPVEPPQMILAQWRRSALLAARPAQALAPADGDNNSWDFVQPGTLAPAGEAGWRAYHTRFQPWRRVAAQGGTLRFARVVGRAEVWVDGRLVGRKDDAAVGALSVRLDAGAGVREVTVVVEAAAGEAAGLLGPVSVTG
jgi:beta-galactosidase